MYDLSQLIIDEEFERVIPPLDEEEFNQLKENILQDGEVYLPIMVWNNIIIDGHHRYKILKEHPEIPFRISEKDFDNRYEAMSWMCLNQLGRRNLSAFQKTALMGRRYKAEKHEREFQGNRYTSGLVGGQNVPPLKDRHHTSKKIANEMGVNEKAVRRAEQVVDGMDAAEEISPGITKELMSGRITPTQKEVATVAKAPIDKRPELVDMLRKPRKEMTDDEKKRRKELFQSIEKLDAQHTDTQKGKVSTESMLNSLKADVERATRTMDFYFREFPEILSDQRYREKTKAALKIMKDYIQELEEQMND